MVNNFDELLTFLFFAMPLAVAVFFIISLTMFISDRVKNKNNPGSVSAEKLRRDKIMFIVSIILCVLVILLIIAILIIITRAIAYM